MSKKAFITGITGQDGSYLAELLLDKGYEVHGLIRRSSSFNTDRIDHIFNNGNLHLHYGDLLDAGRLTELMVKIRPNEVYNLGAQSHVKVSFDMPVYTVDVDSTGTIRLLEAIRAAGLEDTCRFYQASSSEMYGQVVEIPQTEKTPFHPRSPYGCAKVASYWMTVNYRESYNMFACNGILFNHESPRRGETFVTRKITRAATRIKLGLQDKLVLGNLSASRDWGFAGDYVEAMWMMLQHHKPDDYVVATGETHSVQEFCDLVFTKLDLDYNKYVQIDEKYYRPAEVDILLGDPAKVKTQLGWKPKVGFNELINMMIESDLQLAHKELKLL